MFCTITVDVEQKRFRSMCVVSIITSLFHSKLAMFHLIETVDRYKKQMDYHKQANYSVVILQACNFETVCWNYQHNSSRCWERKDQGSGLQRRRQPSTST